MTGYDTFPVEALNTLQFQNNISDGGPSVYRVIQNENLFIFAEAKQRIESPNQLAGLVGDRQAVASCECVLEGMISVPVDIEAYKSGREREKV
jgi:hypothetical protein